jgi:hypothetical protein
VKNPFLKAKRSFAVFVSVAWSFYSAQAALVSLSLDGVTSVDVTNQAASVPFKWTTSEVAEYITITFRQNPPEGFGTLEGALFFDGTSGSARIEVPRYAKPGIWRIDSIYLVLRDGTTFHYEKSPSPFSSFLPIPPDIENLSITVSNAVRDDVPPVVESFQVDVGSLRRDPTGSFYAPATIRVRDNLSGFDTAEVFFQPESSNQDGVRVLVNRADFIYGVGGVVYDGHRGVYTGRVYFLSGDPAPGSIYRFASALVQDRAGNAEFVSVEVPKSKSSRGWTVEAIPVEGTPFQGLQFQIPSSLENIPQDLPYRRENYGLSWGGTSGSASVEKPKKKGKSSAKKAGGSKKKSEAKKSSGKKKKLERNKVRQ